MEIHTNIPLKNYTTMRLGGPARFMADVHTVDELKALVANAQAKQLRIFVLGGGSNVIAHDKGFDGIVIRMRIPGFTIDADSGESTTITVGGGEDWDGVVKRTVDMRLTGIEAMSAIPGTCGAAPIQNIGAYGQELADTLVKLEALDTTTGEIVTLSNQECHFTYRDSIFRSEEQGRYIITSITLKLWKSLPQPPFYDSLQQYFDKTGITIFTHQIVRDSVIKIRSEKLPDPSQTPNTGSFFKNPILEDWQMETLRQKFPDVVAYDMGEGRAKVFSGWLIEQAGLKGQTLHGMRVYEKNALVLINDAATGYADLAAARDEIIGKIRDQFGVLIEQEPREIE